VSEDKITKLDMTVADGIKYIISLGSILPEATLGAPRPLKGTRADLTVVGK
jgi:uncharacterized membrane protein